MCDGQAYHAGFLGFIFLVMHQTRWFFVSAWVRLVITPCMYAGAATLAHAASAAAAFGPVQGAQGAVLAGNLPVGGDMCAAFAQIQAASAVSIHEALHAAVKLQYRTVPANQGATGRNPFMSSGFMCLSTAAFFALMSSGMPACGIANCCKMHE